MSDAIIASVVSLSHFTELAYYIAVIKQTVSRREGEAGHPTFIIIIIIGGFVLSQR